MRNKIITALTISLLCASNISTAKVINTAPTQTKSSTTTSSQNSLLRQDLITLIQSGKDMEADTRVKQVEMEKKYQPKVQLAKTDAQKQALQTQFLTDVVAFKKTQQQKLLAVNLTEPRVKNLRDKVVATLASDIESAQIVIDIPVPTTESQKKFVAAITKSENLTEETQQEFAKLMKEAGLTKEVLKSNK